MDPRELTKDRYLAVAAAFGLTKRELEIGYLKASGCSNRYIADLYGISLQTVKHHVTHIYEKAWVPGKREFMGLFSESWSHTFSLKKSPLPPIFLV